MPQANRLVETVVQGGYCVGCGACAAVAESPLEMQMDDYGRWVAQLARPDSAAADDPRVLSVCLFSGEGPNEDDLGEALFGGSVPARDSRIGFHAELYAGSVSAGPYRERGSSGGFTTWLLAELLSQDMVDAVMHVKAPESLEPGSPMYTYRVSRSPDELAGGSGSKYYPVEMSGVLREIRASPDTRYAVTGLPCFITALRRLALVEPAACAPIRFMVSLFCGHSKSARFAELIASELGVKASAVEQVDFRTKLAGRPANRYGTTVLTTSGSSVTKPMDEVFGNNWAHGIFKYQACDFCDDVVGETADISIGDAWLPQYNDDPRGTNVVIVRDPALGALVSAGIAEGRLALEPVDADTVAESQTSGFRHRREGLAYRLARTDAQGLWRPSKRTAAKRRDLPRRTRSMFVIRLWMSRLSHTLRYRAGDYGPGFRAPLRALGIAHGVLSKVQPHQLARIRGRARRVLARRG